MKQTEDNKTLDMFEVNRIIDADQFAKLQRIASQLQGGSDRERDYGHRLWLVLTEVKGQTV